MERYDAVVVGSGPNGLAGAIVLAREGLSVLVVERAATIGGGMRSQELTLPRFVHDVCSAIHPTAVVSPFFRALRLERHGLEWRYPEIDLAHPFDDGPAAVLLPSMEVTAASLGEDGEAWIELMQPFVERRDDFFPAILQPIRLPRHPFLMARFGLRAIRSSAALVRSQFRGRAARALFSGCAAHSMLPLEAVASASFGMVLALASHAAGWPVARGGSQAIAEAMRRELEAHGGELRTGVNVESIDQLPAARAYLLDVTPRQLLRIAGHRLTAAYRAQLARYRYGPGVFKIDWALSSPIGWTDEACRKAATVHLGPLTEDMERAEREIWQGIVPRLPFILVAQQSLIDDRRAPEGRHTGWAYCHVPHGSDADMTEVVEGQIERFAPGFRETILARHAMTAPEMEAHNGNMIGGDIAGGANTLRQFIGRPVFRYDPYSTPDPAIFIGSSSTPPGGGVHGMCGYGAARSMLVRRFGRRRSSLAV